MSTHGKATSILLHDFHASPLLNSIDTSDTLEVAETSGFQQHAKTYIPGHSDATASFSGRFTGDADSIRETIRQRVLDEISPIISIGWGMGLKRGNPALFGRALHTAISVMAPISDIVSISGDLQFDDVTYGGWYVADFAEYTTAGNTATLDNPLSTSGAIAAAFHITENTMDDDTVITVQHSVDDSIWADLFTVSIPALGTTAELETLANGTINRYVRLNITPAGVGSIRALVALGVY